MKRFASLVGIVMLLVCLMGAALSTSRLGKGLMRAIHATSDPNDTLLGATTSKNANIPSHACQLSENVNALEIWFSGAADNDSAVFHLYCARPSGDVIYVGTGTITAGAQVATDGTFYADTIAATTWYWPTTIGEVDTAGGGRVSRLYLDTLGYKTWFVLWDETTFAGTEAYTVHYSGY